MVHYTKDNLLFVYEHTLTYVRIGGVDSSVLSVLRSRLQVAGLQVPLRYFNPLKMFECCIVVVVDVIATVRNT